jgi:hypothetical protein
MGGARRRYPETARSIAAGQSAREAYLGSARVHAGGVMSGRRRVHRRGSPRRGKGRLSAEAQLAYEGLLAEFCETIRQIRSTLDFEVSSRGWCYILEEYIGLVKGDFDEAQQLINDCCKSGLLPIGICAQDGARTADNLEDLDDDDADEEARSWLRTIRNAHRHYTPFSFWRDQDFYVEMGVEKIDLKSLFADVCEEFHLAITNMRGWNDINSRAEMMLRFKEWEECGKRCVLLYCGDHDPGGLQISSQIMSNLKDLRKAVGWDPSNLIIDRFGLNYEFIEANNLSWIDNLETSSGGRLDDPRHRDHLKTYVQDYIQRFGARKVEANALVVRPMEGRRLCRDAILKYVPARSLADYEAALDADRRKLGAEIVRLLREEAAE